MNYRQYIESYQDFPKEGVVYWDFTPLLRSPDAFKAAVKDFAEHFRKHAPTAIASIESKGFTIASALAYEMGLPLALVRKRGLIPGDVLTQDFEKEYGHAEYQFKKGQLCKQDRVLIIYDILAGKGATQAAIDLVEADGGSIVGLGYVIELEYLHGRESLPVSDIFSLVKITEKKAL